MKKTVLYGFLIESSGKTIGLPELINPSKAEIDAILSDIGPEITGAVIKLTIDPEPNIGPFDLVIEMEEGNYLPLLGEYEEVDEDGEVGVDVNVKVLKCNKYSGNNMYIQGYSYPVEHITRDKDLIKTLLLQFVENGDVSKELMH